MYVYVYVCVYVYEYIYIYTHDCHMNVSHLVPLMFMCMQGLLKLPKITSLESFISMSISQERIEFYVDVSMMINIKVFYKLIVLFLMGLVRHDQSTRVKLQYLLWHLKKEVLDGVRDLQFIRPSVFSHHWPFSSLNTESIPSFSFIWLIVYAT